MTRKPGPRKTEREANRVDDHHRMPPRIQLGRRGEEAAAAHLRGLGFSILARNLRTAIGEVDLLVRKRGLLVAVEVKTRVGHFAPEITVRPAQVRRLERTLSRLAPLQRRRPRLLRVDVVAVQATAADTMMVVHFPGTAFQP